MSISQDCSEIIAQVQEKCRLEGRHPTGEEYNFIISCLQQANVQLYQAVIQLQQHHTELVQINETLDSKCTRFSQDRDISQELLRNKHLEVV